MSCNMKAKYPAKRLVVSLKITHTVTDWSPVRPNDQVLRSLVNYYGELFSDRPNMAQYRHANMNEPRQYCQ